MENSRIYVRVVCIFEGKGNCLFKGSASGVGWGSGTPLNISKIYPQNTIFACFKEFNVLKFFKLSYHGEGLCLFEKIPSKIADSIER